mgnify:CR=1 FL=1
MAIRLLLSIGSIGVLSTPNKEYTLLSGATKTP